MLYDIVIKNAYIVNGTGNPAFNGDIAIQNGIIQNISSNIGDVQAKRVIDAAGRLVTPGFIDPHVHEEMVVLNNSLFADFLAQGVTTIINGNCGHSVTPLSSTNIYEYMYKNGLISDKARELYNSEHPPWNSLTEYLKIVKNKGTNLNFGILLGHGTIRWSVMGGSKDREPTDKETAAIKEIVAKGMEEGALGISTGLSYIPSRYASTDELVKVAKVIQEHDGVYSSHIRYYLGELEAVKEAIEIGKRSGVRVQVSHLQPTAPKAFAEIEQARRDGVEIAIDTIPKSSGHCTRKDRLLQFIMALSSDLFEQGIEGVKAALKTESGRQQILESKSIFKDNPEEIILINTNDSKLENKKVGELAKEAGKAPEDYLLDALADDNMEFTCWLGGLNRKDFPGEKYPDEVAFNPLVMVGSDRIFGEPDDPFAWYELFRRGAFPIYFKQLRERGVRLEEIVRRVSSLPAQQFRLKDRGMLLEGMAADINIIDYDNYTYKDNDEIDYAQPLTYAEGLDYVIINGQITLDDKEISEIKAGKCLGLNGKYL